MKPLLSLSQALVEQLRSTIREEKLRQTLAEMVSVSSINPFGGEPREGYRELELATYLLEKFEALGLEVGNSEVEPGRPNIWGTLKGRGTGPSLALAAHMDTVSVENYSNAFDPVIKAGKLYGRGSCDMKAAFAAYLELVRLLVDKKIELKGDLHLVGLVDEEYEMIGSRAYPKHGPKADFGIIGEPTELEICPTHRGQLGFLITSHGKAAHSSRKELGRNAIRQMMPVLDLLADYDQDLQNREPHPLCGYASVSPNVIRGGTVASIVPDECTLEVDIRTLPGTSSQEFESELRRRLGELGKTLPDAKFELSGPTWDIAGLEVDTNSPIIPALSRSYEHLFGKAPQLQAFPAATDAPNMGFPTVICGPGSLEQAHSTDEFVELNQVRDATKLYLGCLLNLEM